MGSIAVQLLACVLTLGLVCALFVHFRGHARLHLRRQLTDHSTFFAPYNALIYLFSAVPRGPYLEVEQFPELEPLLHEWKTIREEALRLLDEGELRPAERFDDVAFNSFFKRGWRRFHLRWYDDFLPSAQAHCPRTVEILSAIPEVRAALFAWMPPHSRTGKHRDPYAGALRFHLGLSTPNDDACEIRVDDVPHSWRDGRGVVFDATFVHRAVNDTDDERLILFCDVDRPLRTRPVRAIDQMVKTHVARLTAARNRADEPIGFVNRFSGAVHQLGLARARLKKRHPFAYQITRLALVTGLVAALGFGLTTGS